VTKPQRGARREEREIQFSRKKAQEAQERGKIHFSHKNAQEAQDNINN
jgi:hypothetical protein